MTEKQAAFSNAGFSGQPAFSTEPQNEEAVELLIAEVTDEFMQRVHRGEQPKMQEYAARYPQIADLLRDLLPALQVMDHSLSGSSVSAQAAPEIPVTGCLGDFRIRKEIGRGGMGVVYEAEQISLGRRVALKVLPFAAALDPKQLERFKREAQAAAHLHHTNIVPVYGVGCERGVYYYAMQYIEGQSLSQVIAGLRRLDGGVPPSGSAISETVSYLDAVASGSRAESSGSRWKQPESSLAPPGDRTAETPTRTQAALSTQQSLHGQGFFRSVTLLGIQAAEALEHAHSLDVVHRDIKPGNLLIDAHGHLWVTDFGLARYQADAELTMTGDMMGTLRYMSPEQALGKRGLVDHRTDIYSLGATLYELLTLQPVYDGGDRRELLRQIAFDEPVRPRRLNPSIPADLETIVMKALGKEPLERYATVRELADDLRRYLENKPILARRPSLAERLSKWSRRHRTVVVSGVVLLVMAVVGLTVSNVLIARARSSTQEANERLAEERDKLADKQEKLNAALLAEEQERIRAQENFEQARQMLDFFVQVSEEDLAGKPEVQETRKKLLESALGYYREFLTRCGDDPEMQSQLASSLFHLARVFYEIGSAPDAVAAFEQASEIQKRLAEQHPNDPEIQQGLFAVYRHLNLFHRDGNRIVVLSQESVQDHLQLSGAQRKAVAELWEEQEMWKDEWDRLNLHWDERRRRYASGARAMNAQISELLAPKQQARLDQIWLQLRGTYAFSDPNVADALGLTARQRARIARIKKEAWRSLSRRWKRRGDRSRDGDHGARSRNTSQKLINVLTAKQAAHWRDLAGEPFNAELGFCRPPKFRCRRSRDRDSSTRYADGKDDETSRGFGGGSAGG